MFYEIKRVPQEEIIEEYLEISRYSKMVSDSRFEDCNVRIITFHYNRLDSSKLITATLCGGKCLNIKYKDCQTIWNGN